MAVSRKAMTEGIRTPMFPSTYNKCSCTIPQSRACVRRASQLPLHKGAWVLTRPLRGEPEGVRLGRPTHRVGRRKHRGKAEKHAYLKFTFTSTVYV